MPHVFEIERLVDAPVTKAWPVVSDVVGYADVAPNLSRAEVVSGEGQGMVRRCYDTKGKGWNETCSLWEEGYRYQMVVDTAAPDYPYPMKAMQGAWSVEPAGDATRIRMRFEYTLKGGPLGKLMGFLMRPVFAKVCNELLDNWEKKILGK